MMFSSLRIRIIAGFMACVAVSIVAAAVLLAIGVRFKAADTAAREAVEANRAAVRTGLMATSARVSLFRYLSSGDNADRRTLDAEVHAVAAGFGDGSGGARLVAGSNATAEQVQSSQLSAVRLFDAISNLSSSLGTLSELAGAMTDPAALALAGQVNLTASIMSVDIGRLVSLRMNVAGDAAKDSAKRMTAALATLQALPGATTRMKKVTAALTRDTEALATTVDTYRTAMAERTASLDGLKAEFESVALEVQGRQERSEAAFGSANEATQEASDLMMASLFGSAGCVLVLGVVMALTIGGSITRPIVGLTHTMRRIADGDFDAGISGQARKDEIGAMARAVEVFKANGLALRSTEEARAAAGREQTETVAAIGAGLARLAGGDLTIRLDQEFPPDYRRLQDDFNAAMEQLQATMRTVSEATDGLRAATGGISGSADDLSRRTELQAAMLKQTAHSLEEITATVARTAEGASHARDVVSAATADAERSGEVVSTAVEAMAAIERSSAQIADIIGMIDHIATQTSLLSLNAGIEAARAGDAGRGFAVVASEVRGLALRSAEAAHRIKELIGTSRQQVGAGVGLVSQTGQALQRISGQVAEINAVVGDIASSAREQATALAEVNSSVARMDQVTRHNTAMVEDTTAASHTLAQQAEELTRLVRRFDVGDSAQGPVGRPVLVLAHAA